MEFLEIWNTGCNMGGGRGGLLNVKNNKRKKKKKIVLWNLDILVNISEFSFSSYRKFFEFGTCIPNWL